MPKTMLDTALMLARQGLHIFPCYEKGDKSTLKRPYGDCVPNGFKGATTDEGTIRRWWGIHPHAAPAIACGASGLFVIDCDKEGEGLGYFLAHVGDREDLNTLTVKTPHGKHFYFSVTKDQAETLQGIQTGWSIEERKGSRKTSLDTRGAGGYVIACGAVLADGATYSPSVSLDSIKENIKPLPEKIAALFRPESSLFMGAATEKGVSDAGNTQRDLGETMSVQENEIPRTINSIPQSNPVSVREPPQDNSDESIFQRELDKIRFAGDGLRNQTAAMVAYTFGGFCAANRITEDRARDLLIDACSSCGLMSDERGKTLSTLERQFREGTKSPAYSAKQQKAATQKQRQEKPKKEIVFESVSDSWGRVSSLIESTPPLISTGIAGLDRALGGGLRAGLSVLGASPACGKSALLLQAADYIAAHGLPVLFYALEMGAQELRERSILREASRRPDMLPLSTLKGHCSVVAEEGKRIRASIRRKEYHPDGEGEEGFIPDEVATLPVEDCVRCTELDYFDTSARNLFIRDGGFGYDADTPTVEGLCEDVQAFIAQRGEKPVVFVDYLQLLRCRDSTADRSEYDRMNTASLALKRLSTKGFPVVVISSFARSTYYSRPTLDGFKGSGGIEYNASCALVLGYREFVDPDVWAKGTGFNHHVVDTYRGQGAKVPVRLEVRCVKARDFAPSWAELDFYGALFRFEDVSSMDRLSESAIADAYRDWAASSLVKKESKGK